MYMFLVSATECVASGRVLDAILSQKHHKSGME